jgi:hypothetical protein
MVFWSPMVVLSRLAVAVNRSVFILFCTAAVRMKGCPSDQTMNCSADCTE